jgi:hypothetical protein
MEETYSDAEKKEIDEVYPRIIEYIRSVTIGTPYHYDWYAGVTGQKDHDKDGCLDRKVGHESDYDKIHYWEEFSTSSVRIALAVETKLHDKDLDGRGDKNRKGNLSLDPNVVYVFKKGNLKKSNSEEE